MKIKDVVREWGDEFSYYQGTENLGDLRRAVNAYVTGHATGIKGGDAGIAAKIDRIFQREMPVLDESYRVFRGMWLPSWEHLEDRTDFRKHGVIRFRSYVSASENYKTAAEVMQHHHTGSNPDSPGVYLMFSIDTLKGARGLAVNEHLDQMDAYYAYYADQEEILLHKSAAFRVVEKKREKPYWTKDAKNKEFWKVKLKQIK